MFLSLSVLSCSARVISVLPFFSKIISFYPFLSYSLSLSLSLPEPYSILSPLYLLIYFPISASVTPILMARPQREVPRDLQRMFLLHRILQSGRDSEIKAAERCWQRSQSGRDSLYSLNPVSLSPASSQPTRNTINFQLFRTNRMNCNAAADSPTKNFYNIYPSRQLSLKREL